LAADGNVVCVVGEERVAESEELSDSPVCDRVVDDAVLALRRYEAAPTQAGQMIRDVRLGEARALDYLTDAQLAISVQQLEDSEPIRIRECTKVLRNEIRACRRLRKEEGRGFGQPASF
jgi:hypothetical protein